MTGDPVHADEVEDVDLFRIGCPLENEADEVRLGVCILELDLGDKVSGRKSAGERNEKSLSSNEDRVPLVLALSEARAPSKLIRS